MAEITLNEAAFFERLPEVLPLYICFREKVMQRYGGIGVGIKVSKTQIAFRNKYVFAVVSLPMRRIGNLPKEYMLITFGLPYKAESRRILQTVEAYPGRWTHHIAVTRPEEIDEELFVKIDEAFYFCR